MPSFHASTCETWILSMYMSPNAGTYSSDSPVVPEIKCSRVHVQRVRPAEDLISRVASLSSRSCAANSEKRGFTFWGKSVPLRTRSTSACSHWNASSGSLAKLAQQVTNARTVNRTEAGLDVGVDDHASPDVHSRVGKCRSDAQARSSDR